METESRPEHLIATTVAHNLNELRRARGHTVRSLSARLAELGIKLTQQGISKIETGKRGVTPDELVALAVALNVNPTRLLLPDMTSPDQTVTLTPTMVTDAASASAWADGTQALPPEDSMAFLAQRPTMVRRREGHPLHRSVQRLGRAVDWALARGGEHVEMADVENRRVAAEIRIFAHEAAGLPARYVMVADDGLTNDNELEPTRG